MKPTNELMKTGIFQRFVAFALGSLILVVPIARAKNFTFTTIDVPNAADTFGRGIASDGTVVGWYFDSAFGQHGFSRSPAGVFTAPIDFPAAAATFALGIDPGGQFLVGGYVDAAGVGHGFVMTVSTNSFVSFDFPQSPLVFSAAKAINSSGEIVGFYVDTAGLEHGFSANNSCLITPSCFQNIDFPGALQTQPNSINDSGAIVGFYIPTDGQVKSYLQSGADFSTLVVPDPTANCAWGINNSQQIVGFFGGSAIPFSRAAQDGILSGLLRAPESVHGYLLPPGGAATVVNFTGPDAQFTCNFAINDSGMIAGQYNSPGFVEHGFIAVPTN